MDNNMFQRLKDLVTQHQNIGIIAPPNPTVDEIAAGLGMYLALKQMGKNVSIACPTDVTVSLSSLVGIDRVQRVLGGAGGDLVVSFPYREGEIEKVSYTVDNGQLNIVVKAGAQGLSFNQADVKYQQGGALPSLLFMMGVTDPNSIIGVVNPTDMRSTTVVNIDNKPTNTGFGDVVHVSPKFSSVSEMVADFLTLLEPQIELDVDTSQDLLSGILAANNDFQDGRGSYLAFEMAGILMKKGAVRSVNGAVARPMIPPMQPTNYFPPQPAGNAPFGQAQDGQGLQPQPQQPLQQPTAQPMMQQQPSQQTQSFNSAPMQQFSPVQNQPAPSQQQTFDNTQNVQSNGNQGMPTEQAQQPHQQNDQPPADWLAPKVYKGSTVL